MHLGGGNPDFGAVVKGPKFPFEKNWLLLFNNSLAKKLINTDFQISRKIVPAGNAPNREKAQRGILHGYDTGPLDKNCYFFGSGSKPLHTLLRSYLYDIAVARFMPLWCCSGIGVQHHSLL